MESAVLALTVQQRQQITALDDATGCDQPNRALKAFLQKSDPGEALISRPQRQCLLKQATKLTCLDLTCVRFQSVPTSSEPCLPWFGGRLTSPSCSLRGDSKTADAGKLCGGVQMGPEQL